MGITWAEWASMPWAEQRAVLDYMDQADDIPLSFGGGDGETGLPAGQGPAVRAGVDAGTDVIDLTAMRAELEAAREQRRGG